MDDAMLSAAVHCGREGLLRPLLLGGDPRALGQRLVRLNGAGMAEIRVPGPVREYRDLWRGEWAARGVSGTEADESLGTPECFGQAMLLAGDADAILLGQGRRTPGWFTRGRGTPLRFVLGFRDSWCLLADPGGRSTPSPSDLAGAAVQVTALAERITGEVPELRFTAPTVPVSLRAGPRFRSAREELTRRVEEAIATFRSRMSGIAVAGEPVTSGIGPPSRAGARCIVLTHGGEDLRRLLERTQGPGWIAGPLSVGPGGVCGDARGLREDGIVDLAVLASITAG